MKRPLVIASVLLWAACGTAEAVTYTGRSLRDPFRGPAKAQAAKAKETAKTPALQLQGLLWNAVPPKAIVSGKVVEVGDTVAGAEVLRIEREGVALRQAENEIFLSRKGGVKK